MTSIGSRCPLHRDFSSSALPLNFLSFALLLSCCAAPGFADNLRTQSVELRNGWNAVYLEVNPTNSDPNAIFADLPVDVVAAYFAPSSPAQFMDDPSVDMLRHAGWLVWYASSRPDAFLTTLFAVNGPQALLVHAESEATLSIHGIVVPEPTRWRPNAYNFVGFGVDALAAPTFAQFFSGSAAHRHDDIYRLVDGKWRQLVDPEGTAMRSGEAFWIYCDGVSDYQGPLRVDATSRVGMVFRGGTSTLVLRNQTDHPVTPTIEHLVAGDSPVPLSLVIQVVGDPSAPIQNVAAPQPDTSWAISLPPLEAGKAIGVPLEARLEDMGEALHSSLLKITMDLGTETYVPVVALREDLLEE